MFLALDTSHGATAAIVDNAFNVVAHHTHENPRQHTEALTPLINSAIAEAQIGIEDIASIVVGRGPAPFTGLRVGLVTARALGTALRIEVYGVPVLAGIARAVFDQEALDKVVVATDARRKEVYWATYAAHGSHDVVEVTSPAVDRPENVAATIGDISVRGAGVDLYPDVLSGRDQPVDVGALVRIASSRIHTAAEHNGAVDLPATPLYLRRPDIHPGLAKKGSA